MSFSVRFASTTALVLALSGVALVGHERNALGQAQVGRPWLGVELDSAVLKGGDARGARVKHVVRGSPAYAAGVRDGDFIAKLDDTTIQRADDVIHNVAGRHPGAQVRLTIVRGASELPAVKATLTTLPDSDEMLRLDKVGARPPLGRGSPRLRARCRRR